MNWKTLVCVFLLIAATSTMTIASAPVQTNTLDISFKDAFSLNVLSLDGNYTTNGGGDPVPGGGIPS